MNDQHPDATTPESHESHAAMLERLLDLALYAPVGVAVTLRDELPKHVKQGRQALENRVQLARFIGQLAVQTGQRELQKRIEQQRAARQAAEDAAGRADTGTAAVSPTGEPADAVVGPIDGTAGTAMADVAGIADVANRSERSNADDVHGAAVPSAAALPISDYESLPAINVVERLRSMSADEIESVRRFEVAHRARRTILAKIDQLQERQADA